MPDEESSIDGGEFSESPESQEPENSESQEEQSLEELASEQPEMREADTFSESKFSDTGEMPTPTITSEPIQEPFSEPPKETEQSLEQIGASSGIGDSSGFQQPPGQEEYVSVYNQPDYQGSVGEETVLNHMKERGMTAQTFDDLRNTQRAVRWEEYPELSESKQMRGPEDIREYTVTELERPDDSPKSPLDRKRDYRTLKRG